MSQQQTQTGQTNNNAGYQATSALMIRLDTQPILDKIEVFLKGKTLVPSGLNKAGEVTYKEIKIGVAKANDLGVQMIMTRITAILNAQVVQANYTREQYDYHVYEVHRNIASMLTRHKYEWAIETKDVPDITSFIMDIVCLFLSRTIDNKERESYAETIKTYEANTIQQKGGSLNPFKGG